MKKILSFALSFLILLSLCACAGNGGGNTQTEPAAAKTLQVGYGREAIMPTVPTHLSGGSDANRIHTGVLDTLYVTCIAITDSAGNTLMLVSQDLIRSSQYKAVRSEVKKATGILEGNIMVAATHSHSTPDPDNAGSSAWDV